ncbi:LON peptidase substrate-binding domain-containing protein [Fulvimarina sp. 2208YS6-2-32]|uniref:LON peptidase substrate-binding domain-containing protein n=1 Tax=Fulvimarina uroteuthidis TaxID=3098149 RepID=A0ABU5I1A0_9HYPH|nr:LON peptidase substrate-binding domain-containing protein [Fulvimarina sp. 2208YS6-2-32]MDY8109157.1 LON peptidase substrate-binding domain-containing protein [Fulvimarina sp. 2208YS6-2-32]
MAQAGNRVYREVSELPERVPVFPLSGALLLPGGQLPLNIFEPRYLEMIDDAIASDRLIGMIQPSLDGALRADGEPELCRVGCLGRITSFSESGDGRYMVALHGVTRFRIIEEVETRLHYRTCRIKAFAGDLADADVADAVNRDGLLSIFRRYLAANQLEADWESVKSAPDDLLVSALCMMMAPQGAAERQALLEAEDLKTRTETLIAITEMALAEDGERDGGPRTLN